MATTAAPAPRERRADTGAPGPVRAVSDAAGTGAPGDSAPAIRCLIVDDHPAIRIGLRELLSGEPDLEVTAGCASAEEALGVVAGAADPVDVAIVDYQLPGRSGLWLSRRLRALPRPPRVVVYSAFGDHLLAAAAVAAEASAVVSKGAMPDELAVTIRALARGEQTLLRVPPSLAASIGRRLEPVEQSIFGLMASGVAPSEAADTLRLEPAELDARLWRMLRSLERSTSVRDPDT